MSIEEDNKALIRRYIDRYYRNDLSTEEAIAPLASNIVYHRPGMPDVTGLTDLRQVVEMYRSASTDFHMTIEDLFAEGDKVAYRWSLRFTHQSEVMGVAATGKLITLTGIAICRIANGKIREEWDYTDLFGLMQQLGVGPTQGKG